VVIAERCSVMAARGLRGYGLCRAKQLFEFGPSLFDRVEIRRVGRPAQQIGPHGPDTFANALHLVRGEIVHHDQISCTKAVGRAPRRGRQGKFRRRSRPRRSWGDHAAQAHRTQDGEDLPVAFRRTIACEPRILKRSALAFGLSLSLLTLLRPS